MSSRGSQPTLARGLSLLWFPIAFAALLSVLALSAYTHPKPHGVTLAVVAPASAARSLAGRLDAMFPEGFRTQQYASRQEATGAIEHQRADAAVVEDAGDPKLLVATAGDYIRATYLEQLLPSVLAQEGWGRAPTVEDVVPRNANDVTGNAMMFWGLPLLIVGFIASILLLQFAAWSLSRKIIAIAAIGAVSSAAVFAIATGMKVVPAEPLLMMYGFVLIQAISWIAIGMAPFVKQFFVAVAATFVIVLGIPSAGGTVPADLLPDVPRWLSAIMPLSQTISLGRAAAYFDGHGTAQPLLILLGWMLLGAALVLAAEWRARAHRAALAAHESAEASMRTTPEHAHRDHTVSGKIHTFDGQPVRGATITALSPAGPTWSATSQPDGTYTMAGLPFGSLYVAVIAPHSEPAFNTVVIHRHQAHVRHDVVLVDWEEPVAASAQSHATS